MNHYDTLTYGLGYANLNNRVLKSGAVHSKEAVMNTLHRSLILMLCLLVSLPAMAAETDDEKELGFWIEVQALSSKQPARAIVWFERDVTEQFGFFAFLWKESDGYREIIAGPTWKPFDGLQLGVGVGREAMPEEGRGARRMFFMEANRGGFNLYAAFEGGRVSGPWKKVTAMYAVTERVGFGLMEETGLGLGPRVEYNIKKNVQFQGALPRNPTTKETTAVFAINFSF